MSNSNLHASISINAEIYFKIWTVDSRLDYGLDWDRPLPSSWPITFSQGSNWWVGATFRGKFEKVLKINFRGFDNQSRGVAPHKR